jgi:D-inositol-3-phosphate glycosyltransferase
VKKNTLLWVGDAACDSGFARCTEHTVRSFLPTWNVCVLGLNYRGDPHPFRQELEAHGGLLFPAYVPGGDQFGVKRLRRIVALTRPDVVVIQNDPWNVPAYVSELEDMPAGTRPLLIGAIAIDGLNARGWALNDLDHVMFWTKFAEDEARLGGFTGTSTVIPLGVDLNIYKPGPRLAARRALELPEHIINDGFIVLNVNRNQPRKRLDLTMEYFADFYHNHCPKKNAYLYMHVCPTGDVGWDINQMTAYYGLKKHVLLAEPSVFSGSSETDMAYTYQAANVQVSTTLGEGWGLTTMEGMACGLPQVVPDWSALGDWARPAAVLVPCTATSATPNKVNVIGGVPDKRMFVYELNSLYTNETWSLNKTIQGLKLSSDPMFVWENISRKFREMVEGVQQRVR